MGIGVGHEQWTDYLLSETKECGGLPPVLVHHDIVSLIEYCILDFTLYTLLHCTLNIIHYPGLYTVQ